MKFRHTTTDEDPNKLEIQMAPMIDIVFLLLIFFMLTLKIIAPEGNFDVNMPLGQVAEPTDDVNLDVKVRLFANADGSLREVLLGDTSLGGDVPACYERLNFEIAQLANAGGSENLAVEIDADYNLQYRWGLRALSACTGRIDPATGDLIRYVEDIKFTPPTPP